MAKFRTTQNYKIAYESNKGGIAIGIENFVHLTREVTAGTFVPPDIGDQGEYVGTANPDPFVPPTKTKFKVAVDGGLVVEVTLTGPQLAACTTGATTAATLTTAANLALAAAGQDGRVWLDFDADVFTVYSQKTGLNSSVVVTAGTGIDDLAVEMFLLGGTPTAGTPGREFLYMTKCGLKVGQPFELSAHRTGRQGSSIIKKKIAAEGDIELYLNFDEAGSVPLIDQPVREILENVLGREVSTSALKRYDAVNPGSSFLSILQGNNVFARAFNGCYGKSLKISLPGDGEAKMTIPFKARDGKYATLGKLAALISNSANVVLTAGEADKFDTGSRVMLVDIDGRTVLAGARGDISFRRTGTATGVLSEAVGVLEDIPVGAYLAPWTPHNFDQYGIDNPVTGLVGTISLDGGSTTIEEIRSCEISFDPKVEDQDNYYGADGNRGRVVGGRAEITIDLDVMLSNSQAQQIMQARRFEAKNILVKLGDPTGRHLRFIFPRVLFAVPDVELPDEGSVPLKLAGKALQSNVGSLDAFAMEYV